MSKSKKIILSSIVGIIILLSSINVIARYVINKKQNVIVKAADSNVTVTVNDSTNTNLTGNIASKTSNQTYTVKIINNNNYAVNYDISLESDNFIVFGGVTNGTVEANTAASTVITISPNTNYFYVEELDSASIIVNITSPYKIATKTFNLDITTYNYTLKELVDFTYPTKNASAVNFSDSVTTADKSGVFTISDAYGTASYYRGVIENNYVLFANKLWRIVMINGDGTCKLILDEVIGKYNYSSSSSTITYTSTLKTELQNWYSSNLLAFSSYIDQDAIFWQDRRSGTGSGYMGWERLVNKTPSVNWTGQSTTYLYGISGNSKGNGTLTYPIGILTGDELMLAGGTVTKNSTTSAPNSSSENFMPNFEFYIINGVDSYGLWTLNPFWGTAIIVFKPQVGFFKEPPYHATVQRNVKPVIVLESTVKAKGLGTKDNPFVVKSAT